ncbi:MAG TPA: hypothetical protein VIY86_11170, partial [Pirellulaceae bacterium]
TLDFSLHSETARAIRLQASELSQVSAERIAQELRRIVGEGSLPRAVQLLAETGLWPMVFPELRGSPHSLGVKTEADDFTESGTSAGMSDDSWDQFVVNFDRLHSKELSTFLVLAIMASWNEGDDDPNSTRMEVLNRIVDRLRLTNRDAALGRWLLEHESTIRSAETVPWPRLQRVLVHPDIAEMIALVTALEPRIPGGRGALEHCRSKLAVPRAELDPQPLLDGNHLRSHGVSPGPIYREVLDAVRDAQLEGKVRNHEEAWRYAEALLRARLKDQ